ncbi:MAG TPA: TMEM165/GDT1 family protein [Thermodesulfobacteriota bacterium]|nr:TMEM165/GDT1 family protein [Deltaproteobacteria bacterium]HNR12686.1 TMEM165/GDT1 family protein [Thermodesulfobacteriota bacterium]HNU71378.1 TMEM165/GDT1 family protein [Thermodesulfobacteriota bacterium]
MAAFWASFIFVVLAEMGDKTQLLAMAFATRYKAAVVLSGVFAATALNHALAVAVGNYLTVFLPLQYIQIAAAVSFILFGFWTIRGDQLEGEDKKFSFSPFWTVAVAFFFAEMGDKTQLATVALAAKYQSPIGVWFGTNIAMLIADAFGIILGIILNKHIPERTIKWSAALVFIGFGLFGIHENVSEQILTPLVEVFGLSVMAGVLFMFRYNLRKETVRATDER